MGQSASSLELNPERWEQVEQLPDDVTTTPISGRPKSVRVEFGGVAYDRVPDTGWGMLVAWLAGPNHLVRLVDDEQHAVTVAVVQGTTTNATTEPRTQADQDTINDGIDEYLSDAQVPTPPRGYRWYQRVPHGYDSLNEAHAHINAHLREADPDNNAVRPAELAPLVADVVADLYRR